MAIPIKKFGQYVLLQVHSEGGEIVFETDSLKVDFDIRHINGWSRGKVTITNLKPDTIRNIANDNNYVTIKTSLHDSELKLVADKLYISNALEEIHVPDSEFSMYCYSHIRKKFLEKPIDSIILTPTVESIITEITNEAGFTGKLEYKFFPEEVLAHKHALIGTRQQGSLLSCLEVLGKQYSFNTYTEGSKLVFMYKPVATNVKLTDFYSGAGDILLSTSNMRLNPKIGPATLSVVSNLDPLIKPSSILDISELLTVGTDTNEETLQVAEKYLRDKVAGFSKYQALSVQHKGSNWTGDWATQVVATSPTKGTTMCTSNWWA